MAKGKHAAALFEVIHSGRYPQNQGSLLTPKWWFKRKGRSEDPPRDIGAARPTDSVPDPTASATGSDAPARTAMPGVNVSVDPERQHITFRVTYTSAIVAVFATLVVVAMAYLVGRKMSAGPAPAVASETSEQLRQKPPQPDVLNVTPPGSIANNAAEQPAREPEAAISSRGSEPDGADPRGAAPAPPPEPGVRSVNLNYVVVQSYPDEKGAAEARDALVKAGINCTIEQGLPRLGLPNTWYAVVGTQGFTKPSNAECQAYLARINQVSEQYARSKRSFKAFQPLAYKWDKTKN
jgi:hypothetical protein